MANVTTSMPALASSCANSGADRNHMPLPGRRAPRRAILVSRFRNATSAALSVSRTDDRGHSLPRSSQIVLTPLSNIQSPAAASVRRGCRATSASSRTTRSDTSSLPEPAPAPIAPAAGPKQPPVTNAAMQRSDTTRARGDPLISPPSPRVPGLAAPRQRHAYRLACRPQTSCVLLLQGV